MDLDAIQKCLEILKIGYQLYKAELISGQEWENIQYAALAVIRFELSEK